MSTFMAILAVLLPLAACVFIPIWMKKKGKGKNTFTRILAGVGIAFGLFILLSILSSVFMTDEERADMQVQDSIRVAERMEKKSTKDSIRAASNVDEVKYPRFPKFEKFAYYKRDKKGDFNYRIFVFITDASPKDMEKHAKKQMWSKQGTTMVCYFRTDEGLNANAITLAENVDAAINEIWKPTLVARYMHWPSGLEEFTENPYEE